MFIGLQDMRIALIHSFATFIAVSSQTIIPLSLSHPDYKRCNTDIIICSRES